MNDIAIKAEGLGKRYQLGALGSQHDSIRDALKAVVAGFTAKKADKASTEFWALRDASFEIKRGENVGIIGLNGAGKSTLLKVLSQIVTPTTGKAEITGRLGALLEVGTGFHKELTGRENVYLYGSILGMSRAEVAQKFDAIVAFSEIEKFIDTPVKRYSSGMYVRLAFAVAAHLDPDILLLDEVLAVGDFAFQKKCMDFARSLEQKGSTILFVSHNMFSIKTMCPRVIYLKKGKVVYDGPTDAGLKMYENDSKLNEPFWFRAEDKPSLQITDIQVTGEKGEETGVFEHGERVRFKVKYTALKPLKGLDFRAGFDRTDGLNTNIFSSREDGVELPAVEGDGEVELLTPPLRLTADSYTINIVVRDQSRRIIAAKVAGHFHISHPVLNSDGYGVFHEAGEWRFSQPVAIRVPETSDELR